MKIFITGGSGGIGQEIVKRLAAQDGNSVYYTYNAAVNNGSQPDNVYPLHCDFSDLSAVNKVLKDLENIEFDVLINNAFAKIELQQFHKTDWEKIQQSIDVGVRSAFEITKILSRGMKKRKRGKIINILSSVVLDKTPAQMVPYTLSKYALLGLHNAMVAELSRSGIQVNAISPNMVETGFLSELPEHYVKMVEETLPGNKLTQPKDVADVVMYLLSDESYHLNGINLPVLGGEAAV